jgi:hypothetical protein
MNKGEGVQSVVLYPNNGCNRVDSDDYGSVTVWIIIAQSEEVIFNLASSGTGLQADLRFSRAFSLEGENNFVRVPVDGRDSLLCDARRWRV